MAEDPGNNIDRASFSFARRRELPDHAGDYYQGAGAARDAFFRARTAQTDVPMTDPQPSVGAEGQPAPEVRAARFQLPDPRPSFAGTARLPPEPDPFGAMEPPRDLSTMTREAFMKARRQDDAKTKERNRTTDRSR